MATRMVTQKVSQPDQRVLSEDSKQNGNKPKRAQADTSKLKPKIKPKAKPKSKHPSGPPDDDWPGDDDWPEGDYEDDGRGK